MIWTKALEMGIPKIDEQHKELFRQVDILLDRSQINRVESTLEFLKKYVVKHFSDEEYLQKASRYPKSEAHKKLHVDFIKIFQGLYEQYHNSPNKLTVVLNVNSTVLNWLKDHIMVHDKEFSTFYLSRKPA
ncbi:MAG: bacteriohemerythrin [Deltaproteobacteria bacterium]|jgi:hemerythrin|nr:bacteriohemerythrin [Deltaproteobacteria bacterium]